jgi:hypothetical protein
MSSSLSQLEGYLRSDGRKGIRNSLVVAYLVECAHQARGWVLKERPIAKGALTCCSGLPFAKVLGHSSLALCAACLLNDDGVNRSCRSGDVLREFVPVKPIRCTDSPLNCCMISRTT